MSNLTYRTSVYTPAGTPSTPTNVTSITKDAGATVTWVAPGSGGPFTSYTITPYIAGAAQSPTVTGTSATSAIISGLTNLTAYTFTVKATNAVGTGVESIASGANTPRANLIFGDEFNGTVIDPAWSVLSRDGDQSNSELQYYFPAQVTLDGASNLVVAQSNVSSGAQPAYNDGTYPANSGTVTRAYRSGFLQWNTFTALYGTGKTLVIQFSATMPTGVGLGLWPGSGWLVGANCQASNKLNPDNVGSCSWPNAGSEEIDIAEFGATGGGSLTSYRAQEIATGSTDTTGNITCTNAHTNAHTYELDWSVGSLTWKLDGSTVKTNTSAVPTTAMYFQFNVAIAGSVTASFPDQMTVDWLRVFNQ